MTAPTRPTELWNAMPGWGIAADLTPPELINSRQLELLRRILAILLVVVLVIVAGAYLVVRHRNSNAEDALAKAQLHTTQLQAQANKYSGITRIQGTTAQVQNQIAALMASDVDLPSFLGKLRSNLPASMLIKQETLTISTAAVAGGTASTGAAAPTGTGLDTSGLATIGSLTMNGTGKKLNDLADYVDKLKGLTGVTNVLPVSNSDENKIEQFSITLSLTSALLSHRYTATTTTGIK